jgi:hypothetical protein
MKSVVLAVLYLGGAEGTVTDGLGAVGAGTADHIVSMWGDEEEWYVGDEIAPDSDAANRKGTGACSESTAMSLCGGIGLPVVSLTNSSECLCKFLPFRVPDDCAFRCKTLDEESAWLPQHTGRLITDVIAEQEPWRVSDCTTPFCAGQMTVDDVVMIDRWGRAAKSKADRGRTWNTANTLSWYQQLIDMVNKEGLRRRPKVVALPTHPNTTVEATTVRATVACSSFNECFPHGATSTDASWQNPILQIHGTHWNHNATEVAFVIAKGAYLCGGISYPPKFYTFPWREIESAGSYTPVGPEGSNYSFECEFSGVAGREPAVVYENREPDIMAFSIGCKVPPSLLSNECLDVTLREATTAYSLSYPAVPVCKSAKQIENAKTKEPTWRKSSVSSCGLFMTADCSKMKQWLEYNLHLGVEHFYMYDNNVGTLRCAAWDGNQDAASNRAGVFDGFYDPETLARCNPSKHRQQDLLQPYIDAGLVTYIPWDHGGRHISWQQVSQMLDCLYRGAADGYEFQLQFDTDEFFMPPAEFSDLPTMLRSYWDERRNQSFPRGKEGKGPLCSDGHNQAFTFNGQYMVGNKTAGGSTLLDTYITGYPADFETPGKKIVSLAAWRDSPRRNAPWVHFMNGQDGETCEAPPAAGTFKHYHILADSRNAGEEPDEPFKLYTDAADRFGAALVQNMKANRAQCLA